MDKSVLTFPYQYKRIELGNVFNPLIYLPVKISSGWQYLWFLVDSGADTTMLTVSLAKQLGLDYNREKKMKLFGIGEKSVDAYHGKVILKLGIHEIAIRSYFIDATDSTLLLGRLDVFDRFNITFASMHQKIMFQPLK